MQLANMRLTGEADVEALQALVAKLGDGSKPTSLDVIGSADPTLAQILEFILGRTRYFTLHEKGIQVFEDAKDQIEELYPVHTGYGLIYALQRADRQFKDISGKSRIDFDNKGDLVNYGKHPDYSTSLDLSGLNGPSDLVSLEEALAAVNMPIERVKELTAAEHLEAADQRQLDILLAIHRAPVIAGFSSIYDMLTYTEYGNAIDINAGKVDHIGFVATIRPLYEQNVFVTVENSGSSPTESVVDQINNEQQRQNRISVDSSHGGSGEALVLIKQLMTLLNHTRPEVPDNMTFYAGYRKYGQQGFRVRTGFQSI
jgi:hypothetical protein